MDSTVVPAFHVSTLQTSLFLAAQVGADAKGYCGRSSGSDRLEMLLINPNDIYASVGKYKSAE